MWPPCRTGIQPTPVFRGRRTRSQRIRRRACTSTTVSSAVMARMRRTWGGTAVSRARPPTCPARNAASRNAVRPAAPTKVTPERSRSTCRWPESRRPYTHRTSRGAVRQSNSPTTSTRYRRSSADDVERQTVADRVARQVRWRLRRHRSAPIAGRSAAHGTTRALTRSSGCGPNLGTAYRAVAAAASSNRCDLDPPAPGCRRGPAPVDPITTGRSGAGSSAGGRATG